MVSVTPCCLDPCLQVRIDGVCHCVCGFCPLAYIHTFLFFCTILSRSVQAPPGPDHKQLYSLTPTTETTGSDCSKSIQHNFVVSFYSLHSAAVALLSSSLSCHWHQCLLPADPLFFFYPKCRHSFSQAPCCCAIMLRGQSLASNIVLAAVDPCLISPLTFWSPALAPAPALDSI